MNQNYFKENEDNDYEIFKNLTDDLGTIYNVGKSEEKMFYDATGKTSNGQVCIVELKNRNQNLHKNDYKGYYVTGVNQKGLKYEGKTLMIEAYKAAQLLFSYTIKHTLPIYCCFTDEGNTAIIFYLNRLTEIPKFEKYNDINSKGYERKEDGERFMINIKDAIIYKKIDGKWTKEK